MSDNSLFCKEENAYNQEVQDGDFLEKVAQPKKEYQADLAMRPIRPGVRPRGASVGARTPRPVLSGAPRAIRPTGAPV